MFITVVFGELHGVVHFLADYEAGVDWAQLFCHLVAVGDDLHQVYEEEEGA